MKFGGILLVLLLAGCACSFRIRLSRPRMIFRPQILVAMPNEFRVRRSLPDQEPRDLQHDYVSHPQDHQAQDHQVEYNHYEESYEEDEEKAHGKIGAFFRHLVDTVSNFVQIVPQGSTHTEVIDVPEFIHEHLKGAKLFG